MSTQQQRSEKTRDLLLAAFRRSLLQKGLEATTIAGVLADAGLSKGALYHHFSSKTEIVEAIYRAESHGAIKRAQGCVDVNARPVERLKSTCEFWLAEVRDPDIARILFHIGPEAIGVERAMQIENQMSLALFEALLDEAHAVGDLAIEDTKLAARLVNALIAELALSTAAESGNARKLVVPLIDGVMEAVGSKG